VSWGRSAAIIPSIVAAVLLMSAVQVRSGDSTPPDVRGWWDSRYAWVRIDGEVTRQEGSKAWGVVYVHYLLSGTDVYHCEGVIRGNNVEAWHHSGHHFSGHFQDPDTVAGTLTHQDGQTYEIKIRRRTTE
jgi:hypothetical protein